MDNELYAEIDKLKRENELLKNPTPEMIKAGAEMFGATLYSSAGFDHHAYHVYCAMVDVAIKESNGG